MKNKLLLTTALVGTVALSGAALAETKVTGNVETTYRSDSYDKAADKISGGSGFGMETNIGVATSKDLDNGMTLKAGMNLETGNTGSTTTDKEQTTSDVGYVEVTSGNFSVHVGQDYGNNLNSIGIPTVGDNYIDASAASLATTNKDLSEEAHDALHLGLAGKFDIGTVFLNYAPDNAAKNATLGAGDSGYSDVAGSSLEIGAKLSPIEGLSVQLGQQEDKQTIDSGSTSEAKQQFISAQYSMGQFAFGASQRTFDKGGTASSTNDYENTSYGVTYAVNDNLSVGLQYGEASEGNDTADEEVTMLSVGYNMGGMGIEFSYAQVDNLAAASGTDVESIQIRTITKF
jgi:outer membrane protein OmpU